MKREIITTDSYGRITIPSDTGNIWMNEMELVELFGVIAPMLRATIRTVYKCGVLNPLEAEKRIKLPNGYYADMYALSMVVALAFRIDTSGAATVRNALLERLCRRKEKQVLLVSVNNRMPNECQNELFMFSHYNTYADIKRRKNESRTYFFDRAAERLNRRMMRDEEAERKRR